METNMQNKGMHRAALTLSLLLMAACEDAGGEGYAGGDGYTSDDRSSAGSTQSTGKDAGTGSSSPTREVDRDDDEPEAVDASSPDSAAPKPDLALQSGAVFKNYLVDRQGRALYFFANDVAGSATSACTTTCLEKWPVFDAKNASLGEGIAAADVGRFMRADGAWQTTFKGRPLYYFATDTATSGATGDGVGTRWFVARDYTVFVAAKADLIPDTASAAAPYMTNRAGRTVYAFKTDTAGNPPTSSCNDACLDAWPIWKTPSALSELVLPSNMKSADFAQFQRTVAGAAVQQLSYRGWPLYFHTPDDAPGETSGHMTGAWRAIDPASFAQAAAITSDAGALNDAGRSDAGKSDAGTSGY
jgi:predicted lipoprotein with Yx(FWY)xxD motif